MQTEKIELYPDGTAHVVSTTISPIANIATHFRRLSIDSAIRLPSLSPDTWLVYNGAYFTAFRRILRLQLHCVWKPEEVMGPDKKIISVVRPSFNSSPSPEGLCERDFYWDVPKDMILLFVATKLKGTDSILANSAGFDPEKPVAITEGLGGVCGLIAIDKADGKLYRLPLPNTSDDGALCTGSLHGSTAGAWTQFRGMFASWSENQWNRDLISGTRERYKELFLLEASTLKPIKPENPWQKICFPISPSWINSSNLQAGIEGLTK